MRASSVQISLTFGECAALRQMETSAATAMTTAAAPAIGPTEFMRGNAALVQRAPDAWCAS